MVTPWVRTQCVTDSQQNFYTNPTAVDDDKLCIHIDEKSTCLLIECTDSEVNKDEFQKHFDYNHPFFVNPFTTQIYLSNYADSSLVQFNKWKFSNSGKPLSRLILFQVFRL
jgi:hypothetical protein